MSAFVAIKTTLSAAMAKRSALLTRTKVFSRSRRPTVDVYNAQSSPCAAEADTVVDEAFSNITEALLDVVETTAAVVDTTQNTPETITDLIEANSSNIEATAITVSMVPDVKIENDEFSRSLAWLLVAPKLMPDTSFNSFASYSLWPVIPVTEPIPSAPAAAAWTIPQVIATSPTEASVRPIEYSEETKMPLPGDESSAICPTVSVELATLGSITEEYANEAALTSHESSISLAHTYVHGGDLFTIVEADEPLESSVVESEMPSTLLSLPSPFSRGNLCIKDIDALMSSESETESFSMTPSFSASVDVGSDLFRGLLAIHASLPSVPAFRSLDSLETIPDELEETLVHSSSSASVMFAKLKQAVGPGDVDALLRSLVVGEDDASFIF